MPKCHLRHFFAQRFFLSVGSLHHLEIHRNAPQPPPRADPTPSTCSSYLLLSMVVILEPPWGWIPAPSSPRCQFWVSWSAMKARLSPISCLHRPPLRTRRREPPNPNYSLKSQVAIFALDFCHSLRKLCEWMYHGACMGGADQCSVALVAAPGNQL